MTDIDRGAYAPQHDGPSMSFDPRRSRARQPAPFTLIFSGVVLAALIAAVVMFYRGGVRQDGAAPAVVGAPVVAMKGPASVTTAAASTEESLDVYVAQDPAATAVASAPAFAAPPETPQPRPAPRPAPVVVAAAPAPAAAKPVQTAAAAAPVTAAALKPAPTAAKPVQTAAAKPAPAPASKTVETAAASPSESTPAAKPTEVASATLAAATPQPWGALPTARANGAAAAATTASTSPTVLAAVTKPAAAAATEVASKPAAAAPAAGGGRYGVQIGAFSSASIADTEYAKVAGVVGGRGKTVTPVQKGSSTLYRTVVTGFGSKAEAEATCAKLKAAGKACFVKGV
jgi:hypothetical protein